MSGSDNKSLKPSSSQSKTTQTRRSSFGSRKTCEPLLPCCFRFSAPFVENAFQKRSKSSIFDVARTISPPSLDVSWRYCDITHAVSGEGGRIRYPGCRAKDRRVEGEGSDPDRQDEKTAGWATARAVTS